MRIPQKPRQKRHALAVAATLLGTLVGLAAGLVLADRAAVTQIVAGRYSETGEAYRRLARRGGD